MEIFAKLWNCRNNEAAIIVWEVYSLLLNIYLSLTIPVRLPYVVTYCLGDKQTSDRCYCNFDTFIDWLRLEGNLEGHLVQLLAQAS